MSTENRGGNAKRRRGVSSEGFIFGPWMTALRQRSPAHSSAPVARRRVSGDRIPGAASLIPGDGWTVPAKVARRRSTVTSSATAQGLAPSQRTQAGGSASVDSLEGSVPVSKNCLELSGNGTVSEFGSQAVPESSGVQQIVQSKSCSMNPFSVLGSDEGAGRLYVSKDVNPDSAHPFAIVNFGQGSVCPKNSKESLPGTAKRARPVEPLTQRVVSRSTKSKGKAPLAANGTGHQSFSFSASADLARGHVALSGPGTKKSRCKVGHARGSGSDSTQSDLVVGLAHESAVLQLKQAIQGVESDEGMDSSQVAECCAMEPEMVIHPTDAEMIGEEMGVIPSQASE